MEASLRAGGFELETAPTEAPGHATRLAAEAVEERLDAVFALGGDGTLREAAIGLLDSGIPLGILPGGTTNVLARTLALPRHPVAAARCYRDYGSGLDWERFDVGSCGELPFLLMASVGLDAATMAACGPIAKRRLGRLAVIAAGARQLQRRPATYRVRSGSDSWCGSFVALCNVPHYGGRFRLVPDASPSDRRLDLIVLASSGRAAVTSFVARVLVGRHLERADVLTRRVEAAEILGTGSILAQTDGDAVRLELPLSIRLLPQSLYLLKARLAPRN